MFIYVRQFLFFYKVYLFTNYNRYLHFSSSSFTSD